MIAISIIPHHRSDRYPSTWKKRFSNICSAMDADMISISILVIDVFLAYFSLSSRIIRLHVRNEKSNFLYNHLIFYHGNLIKRLVSFIYAKMCAVGHSTRESLQWSSIFVYSKVCKCNGNLFKGLGIWLQFRPVFVELISIFCIHQYTVS